MVGSREISEPTESPAKFSESVKKYFVADLSRNLTRLLRKIFLRELIVALID